MSDAIGWSPSTAASEIERRVDLDEWRRVVETRRDLHRNPELGFQEHRTAAIVSTRLRSAGYDVRTGVADTGVVGTLTGGAGDGPTLLLRADMDALPIQEEATHNYASATPGVMHACGHDAHVAIGLAVAERLARMRSTWPGVVKYVFQPAEECLGGARRMIAEGVLAGVDAAIGLHVWSKLPTGTVAVTPGTFMAGAIQFTVTLKGRAGHAGAPHDGVDSLLAACHVVTALDGLVGRTVSPFEPACLSIGTLRAGSAPNVIAGDARLEGFVRAFSADALELLRHRVERVALSVGAAYGADTHVSFDAVSFPPTTNDSWLAATVRRVAEDSVGAACVTDEFRTLAAEDFSEFSTRVPGCFFIVGAGLPDASSAPHHSPTFDVCEDALPIGVAVLDAAARRVLNTWSLREEER